MKAKSSEKQLVLGNYTPDSAIGRLASVLASGRRMTYGQLAVKVKGRKVNVRQRLQSIGRWGRHTGRWALKNDKGVYQLTVRGKAKLRKPGPQKVLHAQPAQAASAA